MATLIVPLDDTYDHFTMTTTLDGTTYTMNFNFNPRDNSWYFDLADNQGNVLVGSIPCVIGWPLIKQYQYNLNLPQGTLYFLDQTGQDVSPGRYDLGQRVLMVYEEAASA